MSEHVLQIRLLGDLTILRGGRAVELPPSKKSRCSSTWSQPGVQIAAQAPFVRV